MIMVNQKNLHLRHEYHNEANNLVRNKKFRITMVNLKEALKCKG